MRLDTVVIATGRNFPDALSAAAAVGAAGGAVVLVDGSKSSIPTATLNLIRDLNPNRIVIAGSAAAVKTGIQTQLAKAFGSGKVTRIGGADRYATSALLSQHFFSSADAAFFATGTNFPDALAGAALAGQLGAPVLLAQKSCVPSGAKTLVGKLGVKDRVLLGSSAALTDSVRSLKSC